MHILLALIFVAIIAYHGYRKRSLSTSGIIFASLVGFATFTSPLSLFTTVLLTFFFSSSRLTKLKAARKKELDADYVEGGQRNWIQVLANGATGTAAALIYTYSHYRGSISTDCFAFDPLACNIILFYLGHYACCNGDTWSSEIGVLNKGWPILITTLRRVPPGTNGAVSPLGLAASLIGGSLIGLVASVSLLFSQPLCYARVGWLPTLNLVWIGALAGLMGSLIDSLLGATLEESLYLEKEGKVTLTKAEGVKKVNGVNILDGHQINFISSLLTAFLTAGIGAHFVYSP
ncbi:uncharacterized protein VTP21DRAFT_9602 [Calcarisporiella thermophila]|uniref:uncharacterized protein n=1 Tax=Calcarisporiella thermophila TaxID=911321 RepID=UPI003742BF78